MFSSDVCAVKQKIKSVIFSLSSLLLICFWHNLHVAIYFTITANESTQLHFVHHMLSLRVIYNSVLGLLIFFPSFETTATCVCTTAESIFISLCTHLFRKLPQSTTPPSLAHTCQEESGLQMAAPWATFCIAFCSLWVFLSLGRESAAVSWKTTAYFRGYRR